MEAVKSSFLRSNNPMLHLASRFDYEVKRHSRSMNLQMAEKYLEQFDTACIQRNFCSLGATTETELETQKHPDEKEFALMQSLVAAYEVGLQGKSESLCQKLFPCQPKVQEEEKEPENRLTCPHLAHLCPGYSIGCGLCAIFMPPTCALVCR